MTNIDMSKVEYSAKFAGLKNNSKTPFSIKIPQQNLAAFPNVGYSFNIYERIDIKVAEQILDIQFSLVGLDDRRFHMLSAGFLTAFDTNMNPIPQTGYGSNIEYAIDPFFQKNTFTFRIRGNNWLGTSEVIPAHEIKGNIMLFDAPFSTDF